MSQPIILIGKGGHSKVIKDIIEAGKQYYVAGYLDHAINEYYMDKEVFYDNLDNIEQYKDEYFFVIAIGNNYVRQKLFNSLDIPVNQYATLVHPSAIVSSSAKVECGTVVMPYAVINADTTIGKHVIINTGAIIEHDNNIADYVHVSPNATLAGGVTVGEASHIAINAGALPLVEIGSHCIVGAGATVINHVKSESTVIGTPAKTKE
ncbi:acetyltransferase [Staphylococcus hominis]|uniref:Acetyltransferase n=1 Tax=Staphylococcus hominis TaxID=1290 RepID=A0A974KWA9_STAHO|nr:acetyltransferase [Staphylococcus hominis]PTK29409.1 acetyltransferase [Staphylococcus hominis]RIO56369.1 acetyltransferase [Staphylococcus hominis]RIO58957.1 acetyltransferase [Staphylococcus hominis]